MTLIWGEMDVRPLFAIWGCFGGHFGCHKGKNCTEKAKNQFFIFGMLGYDCQGV